MRIPDWFKRIGDDFKTSETNMFPVTIPKRYLIGMVALNIPDPSRPEGIGTSLPSSIPLPFRKMNESLGMWIL